MHYDFDQVHNRFHTDSIKWDRTEKLFGDKDILPMWIADMDFRCPLPVIERLISRAEHGIFGYTARSDSYFESFAGWVKRRHHWEIKKEWIRCSPGILTALSIIVQTFTEPEDKVIIQPPVYHPFPGIVQKNNRELVLNPLMLNIGRYEMDYDDLIGKIDPKVKMIILCNPHNPVGRVWTKAELERLGQICAEHDILVVSDEAHFDLIHNGHRHTLFASISEPFALGSITCTAPSKTFNMAGLQMSNIIIPDQQKRAMFTKALDMLHLSLSNTFGIVAAETAYRHGDEWLDQCLAYVGDNLAFLTDFIEAHIKPIKVIQPEGTYLVWLDCRELGMDAKTLEQFFRKQAKVALDEGYKFGKGGEGFTRVNIACPRSVLEEGLQRMASAVHKWVQ
ncbi:MalY/PatB family protein [Brevibacillus borstelensis]|uniref:MalY/PatB family protein n=1 Tax=Brevibacillus borstelensis TaxID=45462 RepID=UPI0030F588C6